VDRAQRRQLQELRQLEERAAEIIAEYGRGEITAQERRQMRAANDARAEELRAELADTLTASGEAIELTHDAVVEWMANARPLTPEEIERLQAPLRAQGDWYVRPGERFKRYTADALEGRIDLRPLKSYLELRS
jgi:hypothetical protein